MKKKKKDFEKVYVKKSTHYYFDGIIKLEDFDFDNFLID